MRYQRPAIIRREAMTMHTCTTMSGNGADAMFIPKNQVTKVSGKMKAEKMVR